MGHQCDLFVHLGEAKYCSKVKDVGNHLRPRLGRNTVDSGGSILISCKVLPQMQAVWQSTIDTISDK